jgi:hypothetical protein
MITLALLLYVAALIVTILATQARAPLWLAVLLINLGLLIGHIPIAVRP